MKTVEIIVKKSLEQPQLNTSGKYFKLYLPKQYWYQTKWTETDKLTFSDKSTRQHYTSSCFKYTTPETTSRDLLWTFNKKQQI